jgi:hypothetical protein
MQGRDFDMESVMNVIDFAIALRRAPDRPRREIVPHSPGTGLVIDFPVRRKRSDDARALVLYEGNFVCEYDEDGWHEWPASESPRPL